MTGSYNFGSKEEIIKSITIDDKGQVFLMGDRIEVAGKGERGLMGIRGKSGPSPAHQWSGTKIRFGEPDGGWGPWVDLKGSPGDTAVDGEKGEPGVKGDPGPGVKGDKGDSVKGEPGDKGDKGDPGAKGAKGDRGDPGVKGDKGDPGIKGDKGDSVKGERGDPGPKGDPGKRGTRGESVQGYPGLQGDKGKPGIAPQDWVLMVNKVAALTDNYKRLIEEVRKLGAEI